MPSQRSNTKAIHPFIVSILAVLMIFLSGCTGTSSNYDSPWLTNDSNYSSGNVTPKSLPQYTPIREGALNDARGPYSPEATIPDDGATQQLVMDEPVDTQPYYTVPDDYETGDIPNEIAPQGRTVKVALLLPLSGKASDLGKAMSNAAQLALFDIAGSNITLVTRDTKGTPDGARAAAQQVIDDGAEIILGPLFSHSVKAVTPLARQRGLNVIAFSTDWSVTGNNVYTMGFLPFSQVTRVVDYTLSKNYSNIGIMVPQTPYGTAVYGTLQNTLSSQGLKTTKVAHFIPGAASSNAVIRQFAEYDQRRGVLTSSEDSSEKNEKFKTPLTPTSYNAVMLPLGGSSLASTSALLTHYGVDTNKVKLIGTGLWDDQASVSEYSLLGGWYAAPDPRQREGFMEKYYQTFSQEPPRLASLAYDATALAAVLAYTGIQQTGQPAFDRTSITSPQGFSGIDGIFRFRSDGLVERGLAVLEVQRGEPRVLDPAPTRF